MDRTHLLRTEPRVLTTPEYCAENFPDDSELRDTVQLLRRIPPWHFFFDENLGRVRPSSAAFEDDKDGDPMSVYRRNVIDREAADVRRVLKGNEGYALASLRAEAFRSKSQTVFPNPLPEESSHANVCGSKTDGNRRWFAKQAAWAVPP